MAVVRLTIRQRIDDDPNLGFRVMLDARDCGVEQEGMLSPIPDHLHQALEAWRQAYRFQEGVRSHYRITAMHPPIVFSAQDITNLADVLANSFEVWLSPNDQGWTRIRETLIALAHQSNGETRLILDLGNNDTLKRLPWQDWELLSMYYRHTDAALKLFPDGWFDRSQQVYPSSAIVRILVVIGDSENIDTHQDLNRIQKLEAAHPGKIKIIPLFQPGRSELQAALDDPEGYHIFVYVGHSRSREDGQVGWLQLNETDELSIREFRLALNRVTQRGLQLVILNSCDGFGLAQQLAELNVPRCIVFKEPVPDEVAIDFIDRFFQKFANEGKSLLVATRAARQELEAFNGRYSEVTWLPTVFIRPNTIPLTWQTLLDHLHPPSDNPSTLPGSTPPALGARLLLFWQGFPRHLKLATSLLLLSTLVIVFLKTSPPFSCLIQPSTCSEKDPAPKPPVDASKLISTGQRPIYGSIQLSGNYATLKQQGIAAFAQGEYAKARDLFAQIRAEAKVALRQNNDQSAEHKAAKAALQDPEVLIYQNNAEVKRRHQATEEPIYTIAVAAPYTDRAGTLLAVGQQMLFGVAQQQDQAVNADNPAQRINLEIVIANDLNTTTQAVTVAEALTQLKQNNILAVVGHYTSENTCAALPSYSRAGKVVVSPLSTMTRLRENCDGANLFFRNNSSSVVAAKTLKDYLVSKISQPRVAVFYNQSEKFSIDMFNRFETLLSQHQGTIVKVFDLSDPNFDATQALAEVAEVDALAVFPDGRTGNSDAFNRAVVVLEANRGEKLILGSNTLYEANVIENGGGLENLSNTLIISTDWHRQCAAADFVKAVETDYWYGGVNRATALSYEAVQVLSTTLKPGITSEGIREQLSQLSQNPVKSEIFEDKTISFDSNGDRIELTTRMLTTPSKATPNHPFQLLPGTSCP